MSGLFRLKVLTRATLCAGLAVAAIGAVATDVSARELKGAVYTSETHASTPAWKKFAADLAERTNGELTLKLFFNSVLGKASDHLQMVETGVADIANIVPYYSKGRFPLAAVAELPFAFDSAIEGTVVANKLKDVLDSEFASVKLLGFVVTSPAVLLTREAPVDSLDKLDGLNIRASSGAKALTAFGANLVSMPVTDTYLALERGAVDGTVIPMGSMFSYKFDEVVRFVNPLNLYSFNTAQIMHGATWDSLTPEQQKIVAELSAEMVLDFARAQDASTAEAAEKLKAKGIEIVGLPAADLEKLHEAAAPQWQAWVAEQTAAGKPAQKLVDDLLAERKAYRAANGG